MGPPLLHKPAGSGMAAAVVFASIVYCAGVSLAVRWASSRIEGACSVTWRFHQTISSQVFSKIPFTLPRKHSIVQENQVWCLDLDWCLLKSVDCRFLALLLQEASHGHERRCEKMHGLEGAQADQCLHMSMRPEYRSQHPQKRPGTEVCTSQLKPFLKYRFHIMDTWEALFSCVIWILGVICLKTNGDSQYAFKLDSRNSAASTRGVMQASPIKQSSINDQARFLNTKSLCCVGM